MLTALEHLHVYPFAARRQERQGGGGWCWWRNWLIRTVTTTTTAKWDTLIQIESSIKIKTKWFCWMGDEWVQWHGIDIWCVPYWSWSRKRPKTTSYTRCNYIKPRCGVCVREQHKTQPKMSTSLRPSSTDFRIHSITFSASLRNSPRDDNRRDPQSWWCM